MPLTALGVITVPSPGTPIRITNNLASPTTPIHCQSVMAQALSNGTHTNTGRVYVMDFTLTRVATLAVPTSNTVPSFSATVPNAYGVLHAEEYYIDADNAGDGVDASYLII